MKPKQQRLVLAGLAVVSVVGAGFLALSGLEQKANYFYSPADLAKETVAPGQAIRLGGMVTPGSLVKLPDGKTVAFAVNDGGESVKVRFTGITPDLFKEGSGVVADGAFEGCSGSVVPPAQPQTAGGSLTRCTFVATNILAKHDERYMPPQLDGDKHKTTTLAAK